MIMATINKLRNAKDLSGVVLVLVVSVESNSDPHPDNKPKLIRNKKSIHFDCEIE